MNVLSRKYSQNLASNLTKLLEKHKISIDKLASMLGIPSMTVRRLVSGQTVDPRVSTLRLIATYFNVSLDSLVIDPQQTLSVDINFNQFNVPVISWELVEKFVDDKIPSEQIVRKQLIAIHKKDSLNIKNMFALESKPSMYSVYPPGTLFIVAPEVKPVDGDIVLVKCTRNNTTTLKKLQMDLPDMYLCSITLANNSMRYNNKLHQVIGVVILTLFYSHSATV